MRNLFWQSVFLIGVLLLTGAIVVLAYQPGPAVYGGFISIDTLRTGTKNPVNVAKTKISLNDQNSLDQLPVQIDKWTAVGGRDDEVLIEEMLGSDVLLMRTYRENLSSWPIFLSIVHDGSINALHPAEVCYRAAGYRIDLQTKANAVISSATLVSQIEGYTPSTVGEWVNSRLGLATPFEVEVNKLVVSRLVGEKIVERRLSYYVFLRDTDIFSEEYSMVSVSSIIPVSGDYLMVEEEITGFMGRVLETVLEPVASTNSRLWNILVEQGATGYLILFITFAIPLALIFYTVVVRKIFHAGNTIAGGATMEPVAQGSNDISDFSMPNLAAMDDSDKITAAFKYSQKIVSRLTGIGGDQYLTFRDYAKLVSGKTSGEISAAFMELTKIAERVQFGEIMDPVTIQRSLELAETIARLARER